MARGVTQSDICALSIGEASQPYTETDRRITLIAVKKQSSKQKPDN